MNTNTAPKRKIRERVLNDESPFAIKEAFNHLRTNLMYTVKDDSDFAPIYAITSSGEATGKSTIISALSISYTKIGKRVLLIDADMRCPVQHLAFGLEEDGLGLSEVLSSIVSDPHNVIRKTNVDGLDIITSGAVPPNPSELLLGTRFPALLDELRKEYDVIFVDYPPIGIVTDAIATYKHITGYIFVVRSGKSDARKVRIALDTMDRLGAKVLGIVLNDSNIKQGKGGYYSRYHRYGYSGYEARAKKPKAEKE